MSLSTKHRIEMIDVSGKSGQCRELVIWKFVFPFFLSNPRVMNFTRYFTEARWTQQVCYIIIHESHLSQHRVIRRTGKSLPMRRLTIATWPSLIAKPGPKVIMFFILTSVIIEDETRIKFSHIFSSITPTIYAQYKVVILRLYIYIYIVASQLATVFEE